MIMTRNIRKFVRIPILQSGLSVLRALNARTGQQRRGLHSERPLRPGGDQRFGHTGTRVRQSCCLPMTLIL